MRDFLITVFVAPGVQFPFISVPGGLKGRKREGSLLQGKVITKKSKRIGLSVLL